MSVILLEGLTADLGLPTPELHHAAGRARAKGKTNALMRGTRETWPPVLIAHHRVPGAGAEYRVGP